jgi:hypothetical protein
LTELRADPREIMDGDRNFDNVVGSILADTYELRIREMKQRTKLAPDSEQAVMATELTRLITERNQLLKKAGIQGRAFGRRETSTGENG